MLRVTVVLCMAILAAAAPSLGDWQRRPEGRGILTGDGRLEQRITIAARRMYLGELLDRMSGTSGARLEAGDQLAPLSGYGLTIVLHDRPVREVMEALVSLYSIPEDRWYWSREGRQGRQRYVLRNSSPPGAARRAREAFAREFRLQQHRRKRAFFALPADQRNSVARTDPMLRAANTPRGAGFFSFIAGLSEQDIDRIAGGGKVDIPIDTLSPAQRAFIHDEFRRANLLGREGVQQPEELDKVTLHDGDGDSTYLQLGAVGSHGVLGGIWLDQAWKDQSTSSWLGEGENREAPDQPVPAAGVGAAPEELRIRTETLDGLAYRLARLARLDLLFDRPPYVESGRFSVDFGLQGRLPDIMAKLGRQLLQWKHRPPYILCRAPDWAQLRRDMLVPWSVLRDLHSSTGANGGYLRREDWLRISSLRREQLEYIGNEFPDAMQVRKYQPLLRVAAGMSERERAAAARPDGAGWRDWSENTRRQLLVRFTREDALRTRMVVQWQTDTQPPGVRLYLGSADVPFQPVEIRFERRRSLEADAKAGDPAVTAPDRRR